MIPEFIFYLFLFPWILLIATVPGLVINAIVMGVGAQLLNYLPNAGATEPAAE